MISASGNSLRLVVLAALLVMVFVGYGRVPGVPDEAGSIRDRFVGTWTLVSAKNRMKDGSEHFYPELGPHGKGYLMYAADGHMCAQLMNPDRPKWQDFERPTEAEKIAAIDGFAAYCGRYEIDEAKATVNHYPETAWSPNYIGTKQPRPYRFHGDMLTFAGEELDAPGIASYAITWRKVRPVSAEARQ